MAQAPNQAQSPSPPLRASPPHAPPPKPLIMRPKPTPENKDVLVCDICMELYNEGDRQPKFLSCHHSYCRTCLKQVANDQDTIECPSCRQKTPLTPAGIGALQTNFYISQLQDTLKEAGAEKARGCRKHFNQPMSFFCQKCHMMICRDCTVLDHKERDGHSIQDIATADPEQRKLLSSQAAQSTHTFEQIQVDLGHLEAERQNLISARDIVQNNISAAFERYTKIVDVRRLQLLKEVTEQYNVRQAGIIQNAEAIGSRLKHMAKVLTNADRLVKNGPLSEVMSTKAMLQRTNIDLTRLVNGLEVGLENQLFDARQGELEFQAAVGQLGRIYKDDTIASTVEFSVPDLTACIPAVVKLKVLTRSGKVLPGEGIEIIIKDEHGDKLQKSLSWDNKEGSIAFKPQVSGNLHMVVTFRGRVIPGAETKAQVSSNNPVSVFGEVGNGEGQFQSPRAIAVDNDGELYIADTGNKVIQKLDKQGKFLYQFEISVGLANNSTCDLALCDNENLVICTETVVGSINNPTSGNTVVLYTTEGDVKHKFNNKSMKCALCITTNSHNEIIVSDYLRHSLFMYDIEGTFLRKIGHPSTFNHPAFICVTDDDRVIVSDTNMHTVQIFNREGQFLHQFGKAGSDKGQLKQPFGVASDGDHILVVDSGNERIQVFRMDGTFVSVIESHGDPLSQPRGIAITKDGHVYVADRDNHCIKKYRYK